MQLSARLLRDVGGVNTFRVADRISFTEGDTVNTYFQLVDKELDLPSEGYVPPYRRYMPSAGATLNVTLESLDMAKKVTRVATQPFAQDPSIWMLSITGTDPVRGTITMTLTLSESGRVTRGQVQPGLDVRPKGTK